MNHLSPSSSSLSNQSGISIDLAHESLQISDEVWIEVIQRMDEIYANLVNSQVKLEETNEELHTAYEQLQHTHEALKKAQQQLIQSEKMASLGRLVAGVAHELNNPISFVFANMHALQGYHAKFREYINAIHRGVDSTEQESLRQTLRIDRMMDDIIPLIEGSMEGAERVSDIVKDLRKYATPKKQVEEALNLVSVIRRAVNWVINATSKRIQVQQNLPEELILINNEGYIHQILINLIQNAIDAMDHCKQPKLRIDLITHQDRIDIMVRDNGVGIAESHLHDIFDPFFTTKPVGSGTGLGLSISLGLAREQCQGQLAARNHPDGGAEFILSLPCEHSL